MALSRDSQQWGERERNDCTPNRMRWTYFFRSLVVIKPKLFHSIDSGRFKYSLQIKMDFQFIDRFIFITCHKKVFRENALAKCNKMWWKKWCAGWVYMCDTNFPWAKISLPRYFSHISQRVFFFKNHTTDLLHNWKNLDGQNRVNKKHRLAANIINSHENFHWNN